VSACDHEFDGETCEECGAWIGDVYAQVCEQRDDLLAALKQMISKAESLDESWVFDLDAATAAVEKAEGK